MSPLWHQWASWKINEEKRSAFAIIGHYLQNCVLSYSRSQSFFFYIKGWGQWENSEVIVINGVKWKVQMTNAQWKSRHDLSLLSHRHQCMGRKAGAMYTSQHPRTIIPDTQPGRLQSPSEGIQFQTQSLAKPERQKHRHYFVLEFVKLVMLMKEQLRAATIPHEEELAIFEVGFLHITSS